MKKMHITARSAAGQQYVLQRKSGEGLYGVIYKAHEKDSPFLPVAVKFPKGRAQEHALTVPTSRIMIEAGFLQHLHHVNIVKGLDHCVDRRNLYVVMEWIPHTLATVPVTQELVENYLQQMPDILEVLQECHVAHCDLKASNVGYIQGTLKLLDFGLAIPFQNSVLYPGKNKPRYHAPEFRKGDMVTRSADTYSAACLLEHLLTGQYASSATQAMKNMTEIYGIRPPRSLHTMLSRMLKIDHAKRASTSEVKDLALNVLEDLHKRDYFPLEEMVTFDEVPSSASS